MVAAAKAQIARRYSTWRDRLTQEQLEEVMAIKAAHLSGDLGLPARALAKAILDDFGRQGIRMCSLHTLSQWLIEK